MCTFVPNTVEDMSPAARPTPMLLSFFLFSFSSQRNVGGRLVGRATNVLLLQPSYGDDTMGEVLECRFVRMTSCPGALLAARRREWLNGAENTICRTLMS